MQCVSANPAAGARRVRCANQSKTFIATKPERRAYAAYAFLNLQTARDRHQGAADAARGWPMRWSNSTRTPAAPSFGSGGPRIALGRRDWTKVGRPSSGNKRFASN